MKKIFWVFTIRKRIKRLLIITVNEQAYFEGQKAKWVHDADNYLKSRIELKREVADILRNLL
jgi:hypothetical protein